MNASSQSPNSSASDAPKPGDYFATTHWTAVVAAGSGQGPQAQAALEELCQAYWYPLYAFVRHRGCSREDAEDLVQGFFARFLQKNYLDGLSSEKGKFRAFLLATLKHFLANEWDRGQRQKRGGNVLHFCLDWHDADTRYQIDPADQLSPDKLFDRAWALLVLERVLARLRDESVADDKGALFEQAKTFLMLGKGAIPYSQAAANLAMSEGALRVAVHRLRRRYRELLRLEVAQTLSDPGQIEEEMQALLRAFER